MKSPIDAYTFRARLLPPLLTVLPAALAIIAFYPDGATWWTPLWAAIVACGGTFLIAELGRDAGRDKEPQLYERWGGKLTTQRLRHRDASNQQLLTRYHKRLQELQPGLIFPTAEQEHANPREADETYEAAANYLREHTRDHSKFHLVFQALCEYGFRRNLWGLKPIGIGIAFLSTLATGFVLFFQQGLALIPESPALLGVTVLNALFVMGWLVRIRPSWLKTTAFAYADRLLATCEVLQPAA